MTLAMDYLGLDALLSDTELAWRETVRAFVSERIRPHIRDWYENAVFPAGIVPEMGRLGLLGTHLSGYGCAGRSAVEYGLAALELEAGDSGLRTFVSLWQQRQQGWRRSQPRDATPSIRAMPRHR